MASPRQITANRRNAQRSTGPKTAAGKARCSKNGLTHGFYTGDIVLPGEDPEAFEALIRELEEEFSPATPTECDLVHTIAACRWRLRRLLRLETGLFARRMREIARQNEMLPDPVAVTGADAQTTDLLAAGWIKDTDSCNSLVKLSYHESRLDRKLARAYRELRALRRERQNEPPPKEPVSAPLPIPTPRPPRSERRPSPPPMTKTEDPNPIPATGTGTLPAQRSWRPALALPLLERQGLLTRLPDAHRRRHATHIFQPQFAEAGAELRIHTVTRIGQHHPFRDFLRHRFANLLQRDLELGLKRNLRGNFGLPSPLRIVGPTLGQVQPPGDRQTGVRYGQQRFNGAAIIRSRK